VSEKRVRKSKSQETKPVLDMKNIGKEFPGVVALDNVNFTLLPRELHILLRETYFGFWRKF
jgi:ABC-type sugar transport system ATPase subunit